MNLIKVIVGVLILSCSQFTLAAESSLEVKNLLSATFDKPNSPVISDPIAVVDGYAIADWVQGSKGGRALIVKKDTGWKILVCGGSYLKNQENLRNAGVPSSTATNLVNQLTLSERSLPSAKLRLIDSFKERKH